MSTVPEGAPERSHPTPPPPDTRPPRPPDEVDNPVRKGPRGKVATDELLDAFKELTLLELAEFVRQFEATFGVTAAAPVAVAAPITPSAAAEQDEQDDQFDVVLESAGHNKVLVIKAVRELVTGLGLKEAKDLVDAAPKAIVEKASKDVATAAKEKLEQAGARATIK